MNLPWFRMDSNWFTHDKVLDLLADPSPKRAEAVVSWVASVGWSAGHGTDGRIPASALRHIHGSKQTADLLVKYRLWEPATGAWQIHNFQKYQQLSDQVFLVRQEKSKSGAYGGHVRWHVNRNVNDPTCPFCTGSDS